MAERVRVAVVDYDAGNLVSIRNALALLGADARVASRPVELEGADAILVPGVGASAPAMERLRARSLAVPIVERVAEGAWYIGVCLGLQLLFEHSEEDDTEMLGLLAGSVVPILDAPTLPHIGWNPLLVRRPHPVLDGVAAEAPAYFVHSYAPAPAHPDVVVAETEHGGRFASLVARGRIVGFQFHPERSGADGLRMLANTLRLVGGERPGASARAGIGRSGIAATA
jgi:glutamine amidotransferase